MADDEVRVHLDSLPNRQWRVLIEIRTVEDDQSSREVDAVLADEVRQRHQLSEDLVRVEAWRASEQEEMRDLRERYDRLLAQVRQVENLSKDLS